ncbi:beta-galactosidase trimerization domain-containing protein [Streptomyces coeruleorubidus]|uniref:beta-galactosidase trimerization domain-containing protein n=1 Tax=Streptomyces coeruleorubidus TaxID=116188 RepID=UPI0034117A6B
MHALLRPQGAETLAAYVHPHFGRWPAVTTHRHGTGRVTYVGTVPGPAFAWALFDRYAPEGAWHPAHPSVTATAATARDGRRVRFLHNWSWEEVSVPVPTALRDVLSEAEYGDAVPLGPWDVKVLLEEPVQHLAVKEPCGAPGPTGRGRPAGEGATPSGRGSR